MPKRIDLEPFHTATGPTIESRALALWDAGHSIQRISTALGITYDAASRIITLFNGTDRPRVNADRAATDQLAQALAAYRGPATPQPYPSSARATPSALASQCDGILTGGRTSVSALPSLVPPAPERFAA